MNSDNNQNQKNINEKKDNYKILVIVAIVFCVLRLPFLFRNSISPGLYSYSFSTFETVISFIGIAALIFCILALILKPKTKYIFGIIGGVSMFLSASMIGAVVALLLFIDSIRELVNSKKETK